ncbi:MAG: 3-oxoadipate enol-lactonase [Acinetobacter sp.]
MMITITNRQNKKLAVYVEDSIEGGENAPVVLFSNSLGTDHTMWQAQVDVLKTHFKVITYDTRGHGQSDVIENTTLQNLAEDAVDILDALNITKAHFCGISMGGITALYLGIHHASRFLSITVANSAAKIGTEEAWLTRADSVEKQGLADLVTSTHTRWFSAAFDYQQNALAQSTIESLANTPAQGYANACRALAYADVRDQLNQITIPTLIIAGRYDPVTTTADASWIQQHIQGSELQEIPASHLSNIEQPKIFTDIYQKFIQAH